MYKMEGFYVKMKEKEEIMWWWLSLDKEIDGK